MITAGLIMMIVSLVSMVAWYIVDIGLGLLAWKPDRCHGGVISILWVAASFALMIAGMFVVMAG